MAAGAQDWRSNFVAVARPVIDKAATEAGRAPSDIATISNVFGEMTDTSAGITRGVDSNGIGRLRGTAEQWTEESVTAINDYHAGGSVFIPVAETADERQTARARWAQEIVLEVRAASSTR
jgi:hypothetical protein